MSLSLDGKISLICFLISSLISGISLILVELDLEFAYSSLIKNIWFTHVFQFAVLNLFILLAFRGFLYQVAVRSTFLGYICGIGILISFVAPISWQCFGIYMSVLSTFHYSEYLAIAWTNPKVVTLDSFILNHSMAYSVAACSSWIEYILERYYFSSIKTPCLVSYIGLAMCIFGEILRKSAMFTAKHNFNHLVQTEKSDNHQLVTHGIYKYCRHPSYVGWFYWSIGTQLILQNPLCLIAYTIASWQFFHDRITLEEITLLNFFGHDYINYQKKVGTGLPFISGYRTMH